jgi:hypothetical protein
MGTVRIDLVAAPVHPHHERGVAFGDVAGDVAGGDSGDSGARQVATLESSAANAQRIAGLTADGIRWFAHRTTRPPHSRAEIGKDRGVSCAGRYGRQIL